MLAFRGTLAVALVSQMALSPRLWFGGRTFPEIPLLDGTPGLPSWLTLLFSGCLAVSAVFAVVPRFRWVGLAVPVLIGVLAFFDVHRLQPWTFQILLLSLVPLVEDWGVAASIFVATYLWSGLQKLNGSFATVVFPWLLEPVGLSHLGGVWWLAPVAEIVLAALLFFPRARVFGVGLAVAMHLVLFGLLGPLGHRYNSIVWPWNFWMPALLSITFFRQPAELMKSAAATWTGRGVLVVAGLLPALNLLGRWDDNLSFSLYAGKNKQAFILLTPAGAEKLPEGLRPFLQRRTDRQGFDVSRWALDDLNVPPYPEIRVYRAIAKSLTVQGVAESEMALVVTEPTGRDSKVVTRVVPLSEPSR
jgi:hypothetical protein